MASSNIGTSTREQWSYTYTRKDHIIYEWTITNDQLVVKVVGEGIQSPSFYSGGGEQEWKLLIFPVGRYYATADTVGLFLVLVSSQKFEFTTNYKLAILDSNKVYERNCTKQWSQLENWGFSPFTKRSILMPFQKSDGTITIRCDMTVSSDIPTIQQRSSDGMSREPSLSLDAKKRHLGEDFRRLFTNPQFSDVSIMAGDEKFSAHKNILTARSSMFAAMFKHEEMEENRTNEVKIENMDSKVVKGMLEYIYTGEVTNVQDIVHGLLEAAERYDLSGLKAMCLDTLCSLVNNDNSAETLILADRYRGDKLKQYAIKFIKEHLQEVVKTEGFKKLSDSALLRELICSMSG
ncbi:speckle-type POZ protein [Diachasma alloeum]|uniref:speckle-type POZ protein n=1 Tax=Diachasma alloeum TaxID=454923 RepID=UPI0007382E62|nr:speckle-type POZ protein [Diachasma alloeum]XP_015112522.1 speckle-type POZ protein [Diachasma alloeum]